MLNTSSMVPQKKLPYPVLFTMGSREVLDITDFLKPQDDYLYIWVNYHDLTATSLESWLVRGIIPKWP